jgi:hypothetical protein
MKKFLFVLIASILFSLTGCAPDDSTPSGVVKIFYNASTEGGKGSREIFDKYTSIKAGATTYYNEMTGFGVRYGKIITMTENINGDNATVRVKFENGDYTFRLIRSGSTWKIPIGDQ